MTTVEGMAPFDNTITDVSGLRDHYREPSDLVRNKATDHLDDGCRSFIARSTFVLIGTSSAAGAGDVSPKGGHAGFVKVLDPERLVIPDLNGNNRLDSLENIVENGQVGLLFLVPGLGEMLRVNGTACVTVDPEILDGFTEEYRRPTSAIGVTVDEAYIHCAKAIRRGALWNPDEWPEAANRPRVSEMLIEHAGLAGQVTAEEMHAGLEDSYRRDLDADRPA